MIVQNNIQKLLTERILLLDGAMGTMIQRHGLTEKDFRGERFATWRCDLNGCNDILVLTRPDIIEGVHREYLMAGADIITSCTFNAHAVSLADYKLEGYSYEISRAGAAIARALTDEFTARNPQKPRFVAGSLGPTNRTASMSADVSNPAAREVSFDSLVEGYITQVNGVLDGGADIIIIETIFDSLNAKAALYAIDTVGQERGFIIHTMASGTLGDVSGRTLTGQTVEAFYTSLSHAKLISIGFNCAFGAKQLQPYLERLSEIAGCAISAYPNAGLPNVMGGYDETPEMFAADVEEYLRRGLINIVGGCCGTTPQHILCLSELVKNYPPRKVAEAKHDTVLCGLEPLKICPDANFINIGERSNVAGSAKFARLIREERFDEALSVARAQVDAGAQIIDVCMDDGMIDSEEAMHNFLCLMASEPEIARVPIMIDSSKWDVLRAGLKVSQGKSVVNSISLKEGEEELLNKAREIHRMGAAAVVMLFDEEGQADTYERKIEIAERAYRVLTEDGFPAEDIIFDANVLAVATGMEEHDGYAKAFIDATRWIKQNLPHVKVSGGVSNLSFSFRGNNVVREAMHSVFLYHAIEAGMDMAIVNAQMLQIYDQIEPELLSRVEDVILCRRADAAERLIEIAQRIKDETSGESSAKKRTYDDEWRQSPLAQRIMYAMTKGVVDHIVEDTQEAYDELQSPMCVIEELLMPAMEQVGKLFGEGKMFLPQVVKTARVMKQAVAHLTPYIEALRSQDDAEGQSAGKVLIATVKGDVHDIGKNIVSVVISCNGYQVNDLGVMVETKRIVDESIAWGADVICMSGLITPSLDEMIRVVEECERRGIRLPIIIGGATTSPLHTAVKIAPHYSGVVIHANNASDNPKILSQLLGSQREEYISELTAKQQTLRDEYDRTMRRRQLLPLSEVRNSAKNYSKSIKPLHTGRLVLPDFDIADVEALIDWNFFFAAWGLKGRYPEILESERYGSEAQKLFDDAQTLLTRIRTHRLLTLQGVVGIFEARSEGDDIMVTTHKGGEVRLAMLRNQTEGERNISLADFVAPQGDHIGCFALTAGVGLDKLTAEFREEGDEYSAMLAKLLADRLTEAFTQRVHSFIRREMWGYEVGEAVSAEDIIRDRYQGIRMAFGYPATPDHSLKRDIFKLLSVEFTTTMKLSENFMIEPAEALCGILLPEGEYFSVGMVDEEQLSDYARRRGVSAEEICRLMPNNV